MPHEVESMAYYGAVPWHGLGNKIDHCDDLDDMLVAAGVDWEVELRAIYASGIEKQVPGFWALTRKTDGRVFDIVGDRYVERQNRETLEFFRDFVEAGEATLETMGSLRNGQYVWGLANLHDNFSLPGDDKVQNYLLIGCPHEQGKSTIFRRTAIRVVCQNTLTMALRGKHGGEYRMPHRRDLTKRDFEEIRTVLGLARDDFHSFEDDARKLVELELDIEQVLKIVVPIMSPKTTLDQLTEMVKDSSNFTPRIAAVMNSYYDAPGAAPGTGWGVLNAVTHYADHIASRTPDQRLTNAWFGKTARQKTQVLNKLMELV